jgi:ABC-type nitrate/sulfonate/bicarbonate transport system substrate-binding protein
MKKNPSIRSLIFGVAAAIAVLATPVRLTAAELITFGTINDPGYDSALWALVNKKVSDPSIEVKVEGLAIPAMMQAAMTQQYNVLPNGVLSVPQMVEQGIPVRILGTIIRYHPTGHVDDLWVMKDSPIKTVRDLKGKTIGVSSVEAQNVISLRAVMLERYGMNPAALGGDVRWAEIPAAQFEAAIQAGRVDAVAFSNVAAYTAPKGGAYRSVLQGAKELQEMYGGPMASVLITGYQTELDKRPQAYIAFLKLVKASAAYALANQDEVFAAVAPKYRMSPEDLKIWFTTYAVMPYALGPTDKAVFKKSWESGHKLGVLQKMPASVDALVWPHAIPE